MTLKEQLLNKRPPISKEKLDEVKNSKHSKQYKKFLYICNRLDSTVDLSNDYCNNCKDVFSLVEKYNVDISDIVPKNEYERYKEYMINYPVQIIPTMGKKPDRIYDLSNVDDYIDYTDMIRGMNHDN